MSKLFPNSDHNAEPATETPSPETTYRDDPGASLIEQAFAQRQRATRGRMYPASNHNEPLLKKDQS